MAALSAGMVAYVATTGDGPQRVAQIFERPASDMAAFDGPAEIGKLSAEITRLRSETRLLALEKEALNIKLSALESEFGPLTGSIPDADAITAEMAAEAQIAAEETEPGTVQPKPVRTIDIGYAPLPLDQAAEGPGPDIAEEGVTSDLAELADPSARSLPTEISRTRFAIQLGVEDTMSAVRKTWISLSQDQDILIGALEPAVAIAEDGDEVRIRLLAGPFVNAADAIQVCTVLIERGVDCRAVRSEGQRLVMR